MKLLYKEEELTPFIKMGLSREMAINVVVKGNKEYGGRSEMQVGARLYFKCEKPSYESHTFNNRDCYWYEFQTEGIRNSISINRLKGTMTYLDCFNSQNPNVSLSEDFDIEDVLMIPFDVDEALKFIETYCYDKTLEVIGVAKHAGPYDQTIYLYKIIA